jgi:predicted membrane chloride channel (bestrophin family)
VYTDTDDVPADPEESWMRWMMGGKPRNTSEIKLREAEELGGVARQDRYSSRDWWHNTLSLPNSAILRDIKSPVIAMTSWATFISMLYLRLLKNRPNVAQHMFLATTPHSLMVSALGLLLVFRTNSAYQRFAEGRKIWEQIINQARDLYRMCKLYEKEIGSDKTRRVQRLLAAFPYLLRHRIRPNLVMRRVDDDSYERDVENSILLYQDSASLDNDLEAATIANQEETEGKSRRKTRPLYWVDKRTLPWRLLPSNALKECARAQNRPLWVCDRMSAELRTVPDGPNFTARERLALISHVHKLSGCVGACERIHQTVVPLNYARHSLRGLTLWLLSLPFALVKDLGLMTGPVLFLVSWLLFGVYEIGTQIEGAFSDEPTVLIAKVSLSNNTCFLSLFQTADPFQGSLRLSILCDTIRRDVLADDFTRSSAFDVLEEPKEEKSKPIGEGGDENYEESETVSLDEEVNGAKKGWMPFSKMLP